MRKVLAAGMALMAVTAVAEDFPEPGLYKITGQVSSKMMPMARTTETQECIKENQFIDNPEAWMQQQPGQECDLVSYDVAGGSISMEMSCTLDEGGTAKMVGSGTYTSSSFNLKNKMTIEAHGMNMEVNTDVTGTRSGSC